MVKTSSELNPDVLASEQALATIPSDAVAQDAYVRMQQENLLSFIVVTSRRTETDIQQIEALAAFAKARFAYYEILIVSAAPPAGWLDAMRALGGRIDNLRIVVLDVMRGYEDLGFSALGYAIGDHVVSLFPGEIVENELEDLLITLASGQFGLVKTRHGSGPATRREAATAGIIGRVIRLSTGQEIEAYQARAFAITRGSLSRIQSLGDQLKHFRILNVSNHITQGYVDIGRAPRRSFLSAFGEKLRLAADLVSMSSARLLRTLALICFILCLGSLAATVMSFFLWVFLTEIASGWTSLVMMFSTLFAANFGVLGALCLGILQLIRQAAPHEEEVFASEISGGDLVFQDDRLNVEIGEGSTK